MSSTIITAKRSPDAAATSPGYQGSDGASQAKQTTELPGSTEQIEGQPAPSSEPPKPSEALESKTKGTAAVVAASEVDVKGAKASEEDATPAREVSYNRAV